MTMMTNAKAVVLSAALAVSVGGWAAVAHRQTHSAYSTTESDPPNRAVTVSASLVRQSGVGNATPTAEPTASPMSQSGVGNAAPPAEPTASPMRQSGGRGAVPPAEPAGSVSAVASTAPARRPVARTRSSR
jgi:hypothetical protein